MPDHETSRTVEKTDHKTVKSKTGLKRWHKIVIGVVIAFIVLFFIVNAATSGVVKVSNEYVNDIQASNGSGAYALMTKDAQGTVSMSDFQQLVDKVGPILNTSEKMTSKAVSGETGQAGTGKVTYQIKGTDGINYTITVNLQKENGQWRVLNFESNK